jgi:hypothetical protein
VAFEITGTRGGESGTSATRRVNSGRIGSIIREWNAWEVSISCADVLPPERGAEARHRIGGARYHRDGRRVDRRDLEDGGSRGARRPSGRKTAAIDPGSHCCIRRAGRHQPEPVGEGEDAREARRDQLPYERPSMAPA